MPFLKHPCGIYCAKNLQGFARLVKTKSQTTLLREVSLKVSLNYGPRNRGPQNYRNLAEESSLQLKAEAYPILGKG